MYILKWAPPPPTPLKNINQVRRCGASSLLVLTYVSTTIMSPKKFNLPFDKVNINNLTITIGRIIASQAVGLKPSPTLALAQPQYCYEPIVVKPF